MSANPMSASKDKCTMIGAVRNCVTLSRSFAMLERERGGHHQFLVPRIRKKGQPLVELCALRRSDLRGETRVGMLIDEMEHDGCGLGKRPDRRRPKWGCARLDCS
jgi:hypothetical protein